MAQVLLAFPALAQDSPKVPLPPNDSLRQEAIRQALQSNTAPLANALGPVAEVMLEAQLKAAEKPENARRIAAFKRNLYDALVAQSFTKEEALAITIATQPPLVSVGNR